MSLVALGATGATVSRFRGTPFLPPVMVAHLVVYGGLYALFVGATIHAANTRWGTRLDWLTMVDILVSVVPMLAALHLAWAAIQAALVRDV